MKTKPIFFSISIGTIFILVATLILSAADLLAQEVENHITVGSEISYIDYEEPDFMEEKGVMFGVFGDYTYRMAHNEKVSSAADFFANYGSNKMFGIDGRLSAGELDYDSSGTGSVDDVEDFLAEIRGVAGYDLVMSGDSTLTPYFGIGYRYLLDALGGKTSTTGAVGYDRESQYWYMPFGIEARAPMANDWVFGFNLEYDLFLSGNQKSHLEDVSSSLSTLDNDQDKGFGVRGSVKLAKKMQNCEVSVEPFIRYWNVDESDVGTINCGGTPCALGYEPDNESTEYGVQVGVGF